jgi:predicted ATPase
MHVTQVRFEAFKSLYDVTCDLDQFTVITGPNGAGKSNLVDALNFVGEVYADGLEFAVGRAGGYDNVAHRRTRRAKRHVAITVDVKVDSRELRRYLHPRPARATPSMPEDFYFSYRHSFSLGTAGQSLLSDFEIRNDTLEIRDPQKRLLIKLSRADESRLGFWSNKRRLTNNPWLGEVLFPFQDSKYSGILNGLPISPTNLISEPNFYGPLFGFVRSALSGIRVFQLSPFQCRSTGVPTPNAVLERYGENLPGAADHLRRNDAEAWAQVQAAMRSIMPELLNIEIVYTEDRRLAVQFRERGVGRPWNTGEISDGTIQALALFIALYDHRNPLLVVEEPENSVHPWILRQFLDLCRQTSSKQIVVTSHSPVLLNYVNPRSVRLMSITNGRSQLIRLLSASEELRKLVLNGELSMFDAYDSGALPQALPGGFSPDIDPL